VVIITTIKLSNDQMMASCPAAGGAGEGHALRAGAARRPGARPGVAGAERQADPLVAPLAYPPERRIILFSVLLRTPVYSV
jgi:hypothetical protein